MKIKTTVSYTLIFLIKIQPKKQIYDQYHIKNSNAKTSVAACSLELKCVTILQSALKWCSKVIAYSYDLCLLVIHIY